MSLGGLYLKGLIRGGAYFRNFTVILFVYLFICNMFNLLFAGTLYYNTQKH